MGDNRFVQTTDFNKAGGDKAARRQREMPRWIYTLISNRLVKIDPSLQQLVVSLRTRLLAID